MEDHVIFYTTFLNLGDLTEFGGLLVFWILQRTEIPEYRFSASSQADNRSSSCSAAVWLSA